MFNVLECAELELGVLDWLKVELDAGEIDSAESDELRMLDDVTDGVLDAVVLEI